MYKIIFYQNIKGYSEVEEYIKELRDSKNKNCRIQLTKITAYLNLLSEKGLSIGEPYIKHLKGDIWELRPIRNRILFANFNNNKFILLSKFIKQTQKTPKKEIEKAETYLKDYKTRRQNYE